MEIAVIAHDGKKAEMIQFLMNHKEIILKNDVHLIATGTTGSKAIQAGFSNVTRFLSGPRGGDAQIAGRVAEGKTKLVFFFRDPLAKHPHEPDISMLMRLCDVHDVPLATNLSTANLIMKAVFGEKIS
ncbi:methylglyoxal synthase [Aureivirga sp. CE67]|uniref:methylglyoxal synthase n=1 Tax=Aureivirga sp. CE67 TaxID=1788983 RepID=UPI0018C93E93|nr:methylglyoxal synthase [Aureivirga sp. CE67]